MISFAKSNVYSCLSPRQLMMGDGAAGQVGQLLAGWKITGGDVLLVADKEVVKLGLDRKVAAPLEEAGYVVAVFDGIVGEPTLEIAEALRELARSKPFRAVIGMGGGSSLDMSKLAAAFAVNQGKVTDHLGATSFDKTPLPLINIPTTAGTGAEATAVSMLSVQGSKAVVVGPQLVPLATVLDAELTRTLPPKITAATGMDALSHALEGFMSVNASPYTDTQATTCMSIVARWLKPAFEDGSNMEARRAMIYGAYIGGLTLKRGRGSGTLSGLHYRQSLSLAPRRFLRHGLALHHRLQPEGHTRAHQPGGRPDVGQAWGGARGTGDLGG